MTGRYPVWLLWTVALTTLFGHLSANWNLSIDITFPHSSTGNYYNITCQSPGVSECEFRIHYYENSSDSEIIHCSKKREFLWEDGRMAQCIGEENCGLKMLADGTINSRYVVGCKGKRKIDADGWKYKYGAIFEQGGKVSAQNLPNAVVVNPGDTKQLLATYSPNIRDCLFSLPKYSRNNYVNLSRGLDTPNTTHYGYAGGGLDSGECGISLFNVSEEDNGLVWMSLGYDSDSNTYSLLHSIITAKPPAKAKLSLEELEHDNVKAVCEVSASRPAPRIRWWHNTRLIRDDRYNNVDLDQWRWPWSLEALTQVEIIRLRNKNDTIVCQVTHEGVDIPVAIEDFRHGVDLHLDMTSSVLSTPLSDDITSTYPPITDEGRANSLAESELKSTVGQVEIYSISKDRLLLAVILMGILIVILITSLVIIIMCHYRSGNQSLPEASARSEVCAVWEQSPTSQLLRPHMTEEEDNCTVDIHFSTRRQSPLASRPTGKLQDAPEDYMYMRGNITQATNKVDGQVETVNLSIIEQKAIIETESNAKMCAVEEIESNPYENLFVRGKMYPV